MSGAAALCGASVMRAWHLSGVLGLAAALTGLGALIWACPYL